MPSAKQQPSNIKHDVGIRPNICKLTFGPPCIIWYFELLISPSIYDIGIEARLTLCNAISDGRPPLYNCNTSSGAGVLSSELRIEDDSDRKLPTSKVFMLL